MACPCFLHRVFSKAVQPSMKVVVEVYINDFFLAVEYANKMVRQIKEWRFEEIALARISSTLHKFFAKIAQTNLLILDDFGVKVLEGQQLLDLMEIIEDRHGRNSTIIVSQLPVANWYDILNGNTTAADAILDRIVHTSKRFTLSGSSLRKK